MPEAEIEVPANLEVAGTSASESTEPLAQPDQNVPSTGTEQPAEGDTSADAKGDKPDGETTDTKAEEQPKKAPWFVDRIARQREANADLARRNEELAARLTALESGQRPEADNQQPLTEAEVERRVEAKAQARAAQLAEQRLMQTKLASFDTAGRKDFPDFVNRCNTIASLGGAENPAFMSVITDMDDGHKVVAQLADDPAKAMEILNLPPLRMAAALARLSVQTAKPPPVSKTPAPVRPVNGSARVDRDETRISDAEWFAKHPNGAGV
jgi:hypothetical protein